jgi:hypothetical protein
LVTGIFIKAEKGCPGKDNQGNLRILLESKQGRILFVIYAGKIFRKDYPIVSEKLKSC